MDTESRLAQLEAQFAQLNHSFQRMEKDLRDDRVDIRKQLSEIMEAIERRQADFVREREMAPHIQAVNKTMTKLRDDHDQLNAKVDKLLGWRNFVIGATVLLSFIIGVLAHSSLFIRKLFGL